MSRTLMHTEPLRFATLEEYNYVRYLITIVCEGIATCMYYEQIKSHIELSDNKSGFWFIHTQNSYQLTIVTNWNKLFGSWPNEPTHYKRLATLGNLAQYIGLSVDSESIKRAELKQKLLLESGMTVVEFDQYWHHMNPYRNQHLVHTENDPNKEYIGTHPNIAPAFITFKALYTILLSMIQNMPTQQNAISRFPLPSPVSSIDEVVRMYNADLVNNPIANAIREVES